MIIGKNVNIIIVFKYDNIFCFNLFTIYLYRYSVVITTNNLIYILQRNGICSNNCYGYDNLDVTTSTQEFEDICLGIFILRHKINLITQKL